MGSHRLYAFDIHPILLHIPDGIPNSCAADLCEIK